MYTYIYVGWNRSSSLCFRRERALLGIDEEITAHSLCFSIEINRSQPSCVYIHMYVYIGLRVCIYTSFCMCMHMYIYIYICIMIFTYHVYIHVHICTYTQCCSGWRTTQHLTSHHIMY